jgi:O-antigen/teichoic acid export membrane protein
MIIKNWFIRLGGAVFFIFLARQLEMDTLGLVSLYVLIFNAGELLVENGISDALASNRIKTSRFGFIVAAFIATVISVLAAISWHFSEYLQINVPGYAIGLFIFYCYLSSYSFVIQGILRRESNFVVLAKRSAYSVTSAFIFATVYFFYSPGADAMLCYFTISALMTVVLFLNEHRKLVLSGSEEVEKEKNPRSALMHVARFFSFKLSSFISGRSLELFVFIKFGPIGLATLVIGSRIYNVFGYFIKSVLHDYVFDINNVRHDTSDIESQNSIQRTILFTTMFAAPVFLGCAAIAGPLLTLLVGSDKADIAEGFLQIFCVLGLIEVIQFILFTNILSSSESLLPVKFQLFRASLLLCVFLLADTAVLANYVVISVILTGSVPLLFILFSLVRRHVLSVENLWPFAMYLISAGIMTVTVAVAENYLSTINFLAKSDGGNLIVLLLVTMLGVIVYPLLNLLVNRQDFKAQLSVILKKKRRAI